MTTLSTPCSGSIRAAHVRLRLRARGALHAQRRPVRTIGQLACRKLRRASNCVARIALQRLRPSPPLRGFLPLYRH
ncbi:MAG TPA: hypothetical protein VIL19_06935 [Casimicrobiaceae bacterium]